MYNQFQLREIFHIEFLRYLAADLPSGVWALKGGVNLRLFFKSIRYSEDMDLDIQVLPVNSIKKRVLRLLGSPSFKANLKTYGIREIKPPDIGRAKQTLTTQRFKVHLITSSGEDYFTKIEFSRRGFLGVPVSESAPANILRPYSMSPFIVHHYPAEAAVAQKISALLSRTIVQARDVFDLYMLSSQTTSKMSRSLLPSNEDMEKVRNNILNIGFAVFNDVVAAYLSPDERRAYASSEVWEEIKLKTIEFIEELIVRSYI
ncbi:MAG: nucleotidyl transferase AbiEii/AbiGii toxin family protein [Elusimicrobia bacterium]|nr:nucleotidyl transferase AbiEii/AbiGii toxin family protein [Elusimicrobiota bacterium]